MKILKFSKKVNRVISLTLVILTALFAFTSSYIYAEDLNSEEKVEEQITGTIQYTGNLTSDGVNVRSGPGTNFGYTPSNGTVSAAVNYVILGYEINEKNETWIKIQITSNEIGYVRQDLFRINSLNILDNVEDGEIVETLNADDEVIVLEYNNKNNKDSKGNMWYKVKTLSNNEGYISSKVVKLNINDDFEIYLEGQGFPESYREALRELHKLHPNWIFKAVNTGIEWSKALEVESKVPAAGTPHRLVTTSANEASRSVDKYAYDLETGTYIKKADGSSYYAASTLAVAFYMDPRNFLDAENVFMFLLLGYDAETQTKEGLQQMLNGTFMEGEFPEDSFETWADCIMECARQSGVSPYEIASTILQEQGVSGYGGSISGNISGYEGYYNFFNIGASGSDAIVAGLRYASGGASGTGTSYNRPWNSRYKSILGGALWHASEYIADGQNTKYLVNWDVNRGLSKLASHQYATYIGDTLSKTSYLYQSYSSFLEMDLVFEIPIFENMPDNASPRPQTGNNINYLKSINVIDFNLNQTFNPYTYNYDLIVDPTVETVEITAETYKNDATIMGTGVITLLEGESSITKVDIVVTSSSGLERTYQVSIAKAKGGQKPPNPEVPNPPEPEEPDDPGTELPDNPEPENPDVTNDYIYGIELGTTYEELVRRYSSPGCSLEIYEKNGNDMTGGIATTGVRIVVKNDEGVVLRDSKIVVRGDINSDGTITTADLVFLRKYIVDIISLDQEFLNSADINHDGKVTTTDLVFMRKYLVDLYTIVQ